MMEERQNFLAEIEKNLSDEAKGIQKKIDENLLRISETEEYLNSIFSRESEDFKVFSPRNAENIYKEDIDDHKSKKHQLELENRELYSRLNKINYYLDGLKGTVQKNAGQNDMQILDVQEKERQRIARDLHDTALQNLTYLVHEVELASKYMDKDILQAKLELSSINNNLKMIIEEIRNTIFDLRPMHFDDLGLKACLERFLSKIKEANKAFDFIQDIEEVACEEEAVLLTVYRVVQEAVSNSVKHSEGNKVWVRICTDDDDCRIEVRDNGKGFAKESGTGTDNRHFGISVMEERVNLLGGTISIEPIIGEGTVVSARVPLRIRSRA